MTVYEILTKTEIRRSAKLGGIEVLTQILRNDQRQLIARGLAIQSLQDLGFAYACEEVAKDLHCHGEFVSFCECLRSPVEDVLKGTMIDGKA